MKKYYQSIQLIDAISTDHLTRDERVHFDCLPTHRKNNYLNGRFVLKSLYKRVIKSIPYCEIETNYIDGKPFIVSDPLLSVSISHSGKYVAAAIGDLPVGIDIECIRKTSRQLGEYIATSEEIKIAGSLLDERVQGAELLLWCAKEAALKADNISAPPWDYRLVKVGKKLEVHRNDFRWAIYASNSYDYQLCSAIRI